MLRGKCWDFLGPLDWFLYLNVGKSIAFTLGSMTIDSERTRDECGLEH